MKAFQTITATAAPLLADNVDTDQIIPARFLKYPREGGYGSFLFHDQRIDASGARRADFVLNQPEFENAEILVAGPNFGNGSSREGAVYALANSGIRCVIAPSFGQIFYKNCVINGIVPAIVSSSIFEKFVTELRGASFRLTVNLQELSLTPEGGHRFEFKLEPFYQKMLMDGVDEIGLTLSLRAKIDAFENAYYEHFPFLKRTG